VSPESSADHWILNNLQRSQKKIAADLEKYRFSEAYETLYHFIWDDLADWYIEASKSMPNKQLLAYLLEQVLLLAHPFAPFLTETIWQTLAWEDDSVLAMRVFGKPLGSDKKRAAEFTKLQTIITEVRFITNALRVSGSTLYFSDSALIANNGGIIKGLARLKAVEEAEAKVGVALTGTAERCWLDIAPEAAKAYLSELTDKRKRQESLIKQLESRLDNKSYVDNAPAAIVRQTKDQLEAARIQLAALEAEQERFR
jgi:valyl-tRNA synthetase